MRIGIAIDDQQSYIIIINNDNEMNEVNLNMKLHYGFDELKDIDFMAFIPIILPFILVGSLLVLLALFDLFRHKSTRKNILIWALVIIFVNTIGPILYFVIGRKDREKS
ncbi:hypothetical protein J45TS6_38790 [Paenibacillus sp. J45TS6]|nr:hypothetical protein J45TS6_38790 [Paenibacillus sp. J45TS6]